MVRSRGRCVQVLHRNFLVSTQTASDVARTHFPGSRLLPGLRVGRGASSACITRDELQGCKLPRAVEKRALAPGGWRLNALFSQCTSKPRDKRRKKEGEQAGGGCPHFSYAVTELTPINISMVGRARFEFLD